MLAGICIRHRVTAAARTERSLGLGRPAYNCRAGWRRRSGGWSGRPRRPKRERSHRRCVRRLRPRGLSLGHALEEGEPSLSFQVLSTCLGVKTQRNTQTFLALRQKPYQEMEQVPAAYRASRLGGLPGRGGAVQVLHPLGPVRRAPKTESAGLIHQAALRQRIPESRSVYASKVLRTVGVLARLQVCFWR